MYIEERRHSHPLAWRKRTRAWKVGFLSGSYVRMPTMVDDETECRGIIPRPS